MPTYKPDATKDSKSPNLFARRKQLEQNLDHITQEMYKRNKELAETNKTLSLLRTIDSLVLESHSSLKQVCEQICQAITQLTDYEFAGLFTRPAPPEAHMTLYGWSDKHQSEEPVSLSKPLHLKLSDPW